MEIEANTQALINISRKRLCNQASKETRQVMEKIKNEVAKKDNFVAEVMVKECIYRGFCPEMQSCGYDKTEQFKKELEEYRKTKGE
jgi:thymidylate synthase ThyX